MMSDGTSTRTIWRHRHYGDPPFLVTVYVLKAVRRCQGDEPVDFIETFHSERQRP